MLIKRCRIGTQYYRIRLLILSPSYELRILSSNPAYAHFATLYLLISGKGTLEHKISMSEIYIWQEMF